MDDQLKQSIKFDIEQLEQELKKIENEIQYKEGELKFVSSKVKGVGTGAGFVSGALTALSFLPAGKGFNIVKNIAPVTGIKGAEMGYEAAEKSLQILETDIALLMRDRNNILNRLKIAKRKLKK